MDKTHFKWASRMEFSSTEVALTEQGQFVAVDYLNDECDLRPKSHWPVGLPDELVRRVAQLLAQKAIAKVHTHPLESDLIQ